eukprot:COSAG06_NODE_4249_length_4434_cov_2.867820_2_plen_98_part_00
MHARGWKQAHFSLRHLTIAFLYHKNSSDQSDQRSEIVGLRVGSFVFWCVSVYVYMYAGVVLKYTEQEGSDEREVELPSCAAAVDWIRAYLHRHGQAQ